MTEKEIKKRKRYRLRIDMIVDKIKEIDSSISDYSKYMDETSFTESNEVQKLYEDLKMLGLDLFYEKED